MSACSFVLWSWLKHHSRYGTCVREPTSSHSLATRVLWATSRLRILIRKSYPVVWIAPLGSFIFQKPSPSAVSLNTWYRLWDLAAGKCMNTLTHHKKSVRALAIHPTEYSFASASSGGNNIKKWKCPEGIFVNNFVGHEAIINTLSINSEGVLFSGGKFYFLSCGPSLNYHQRTTVPSHYGITRLVCLSNTSRIFRNLVHSMPKR